MKSGMDGSTTGTAARRVKSAIDEAKFGEYRRGAVEFLGAQEIAVGLLDGPKNWGLDHELTSVAMMASCEAQS